MKKILKVFIFGAVLASILFLAACASSSKKAPVAGKPLTLPPAKPEACKCEPLKAVILLANLKVAVPYLNKLNWSNRRSSCSWDLMYSRTAFSSRPTVET